MNKYVVYSIFGFGVVVAAISFVVFDDSDQVAENWYSAIHSCAQTDIINPSEYVFFGPSNNIPPGSIWRKTENNGFALRWNVNDIHDAASINMFTENGAWASCAFTMKLATTVKPSAFLDAGLNSLTSKMASTIGKSSSARIGFDQWRLDLLKEGPYFQHLMQSELLSEDVSKEGRVIMYKGLLIRGFFMELDFDKSLESDFDVAAKNPTLSAGSELNITKVSESTLRIESSSEVYIAGAFAEYSEVGFGNIYQPPKLLPVSVPNGVVLSREASE